MYTFRAKSIQFNVWFLRRMFFPLCWRGCHLYHVWEIHLKLYYSMDFSVWKSKQNYEKDQFFEWLYQCFIRLRKYFLLRITFPRFMLIQDICQATYIKCVPYFSCFLIHASAQLIIYNSFIKQFAVQMWWKLVLVTNDFLYYICDGVSVLFEMQTVGKVDEMVISLYCLSNWKMNSLWRS